MQVVFVQQGSGGAPELMLSSSTPAPISEHTKLEKIAGAVATNGSGRNSEGEMCHVRIPLVPLEDCEPITAEWLASCGGAVTAYGSSVEVYRFSEVSVRFVDGKLARVWTGMSEFPGVRTRRDLQTLLGFLGLKSLKETAP